MRRTLRRSLWTGIGLAVVGGLGWMLKPEPLLVEVAPVTRGAVRVTVSGEGRTRVKTLYAVTAPVDGELERIELEPGAEVSGGAVVARIRPAASRPLDARSRAEATATIAAAREAVARADAAEREAQVGVEHVESKLARTQRLAESGAVSQADLQHGGHELQMSQQSLESARAAAREARAQLARANAVLAPPARTDRAPVVEVRAPARGQVLRVVQESAGAVAVGMPLVELGDVAELEIVAELLSSDAALVQAGSGATLSGWGAERELLARVRRVEPAGFTKVSALGLEEQRVRIVLDLTDPPPTGLGHNYRVDVAIAVWEGKDVVRAPSTALFRVENRWAALVIRDSRAHLTQVETSRSDAAWTVIEKGLAPGDKVIVQPSDAIQDGTRIGVLREVVPLELHQKSR